MPSKSSQVPVSVYDVPVADRKTRPIAELMTIATGNAVTAAVPDAGTRDDPDRKTRYRVWDLHTSLHCSIIGTCLTQAELVRLLRRLKVEGVDTASDHDLHMLGVLLAARPKEGAKLLQKVLDKRHSLAIKRFAKARNLDELAALWREALNGGDIPGAYWAILTHPVSSDKLTRRVFGDVHMLSHLVGATNRADIHRLRELEQQNTALVEKIDSQQKRLRGDLAERDETIRGLRNLLARKTDDERRLTARANGASNLLEVVHELERRLDEEIARRQAAENNVAFVSAAYEDANRNREAAESERDALRREMAAIESQLDAVLQPEDDPPSNQVDLSGMTVLYVGGRAKQVPQLRALVERVNGQFLHHDGGLEDSAALLPGLVSRAHIAVFPVDCVSHNAVTSVKRFCEQLGRPYVPIRTSSLSCLLSALATLPHGSFIPTLQ